MQVTLNFTEGNKPEAEPGTARYYFVRTRSRHDGKVRTHGAYYLSKYGLVYEYGSCPGCPDPEGGPKCLGAETGECPTTGWFDEVTDPEFDSVYEPLSGEVIAFTLPPEPETI